MPSSPTRPGSRRSRPRRQARSAARRASALLGIAALLAPALPLWSAIAGVPEAPRPGPYPAAWVEWSNDSFGGEMGHDSDDYRTNAFSGGAHRGRWLFGADYSMLTDYRSPGATGTRSDEATVTVGWQLLPEGSAGLGGTGTLAAGAGLRLAGDLGGGAVQNRFHDSVGYQRVDIPYQGGGLDGVGYAAGSWMWLNDESGWWTPFGRVDEQRIGVEITGAALASTGGELQSELGLRVLVLGQDGSLSLGLRRAWNGGHHASLAAHAVGRHEDGTWLVVGSSAGGWSYEAGFDLADQATMGHVGWSWGRGPARSDRAGRTEMEGIIGLYQGYSLGVQYRWQPTWMRGDGPLQTSLLFDYRFGQYPGPDWNDNVVIVRQPVLGVDLSWGRPHDGFQCTPFTYVAVGIREERVRASGDFPRFPDQSATRGVVQGGLGARLYWGRLPQGETTARYGISVLYEAWKPFSDARAVAGSDSDTYQRASGGLGLRLAATVAW